jgi:polyphosphate kinase
MGKKIHPNLLIHAPFNLKKSLLKMIAEEAQAAREGKDAHIIAKLNALTDPEMIRALYEASNAGVKIDLIVRGMCCLRPGIEGVSENIRVVSIIGRFLEHSRVYYFKNSDQQLFCSSADWMERNLSNRIEVCFPILKKKHQSRILAEINWYLEDEAQCWELGADGEYTKIHPVETEGLTQGVQQKLLEKLS